MEPQKSTFFSGPAVLPIASSLYRISGKKSFQKDEYPARPDIQLI